MSIRSLQARDAAGVVALTRETQGDAYPRVELHDPVNLMAAVEAGALVGCVAEDEAGRIVGFAALEPWASGPIAELGMVMVSERARRTGLAEGLRDFALERARALDLAGQYVEVSCADPGGQALAERAGIVPCGLMLGLWPDYLHAGHGRTSFVRYYRALRPLEPTTAFVPSYLREPVTRIAARLDRDVTFGPPSAAPAGGTLEVTRRPHEQCIFAVAPHIGADTFVAFEAVVEAFTEDAGVAFLALDLPLDQPAAVELCLLADAFGMSFASLTPRAFGAGDGLRLQLCKQPPDEAALLLLNPFMRELLASMVPCKPEA